MEHGKGQVIPGFPGLSEEHCTSEPLPFLVPFLDGASQDAHTAPLPPSVQLTVQSCRKGTYRIKAQREQLIC